MSRAPDSPLLEDLQPVLRPLSRLVWAGFALLVAGFLLLPLILMGLFSLNESALTRFPLTGLTLDWYRRLFADPALPGALAGSVQIAAVVAAVTVTIGLLAALRLARLRPGRAGVLLALLGLPMMFPALIVAVSLLGWFNLVLGVPLGLHTVMIGQAVIIQPFVIALLYARLQGFDWTMLDSARDLGATPLRAFWDITLPNLGPSLVGAFLVAVALSLDDFVIAFQTLGPGNILPTFIWGKVRTTLDPSINALGTLLLLASIGCGVIALRLTRYRG